MIAGNAHLPCSVRGVRGMLWCVFVRARAVPCRMLCVFVVIFEEIPHVNDAFATGSTGIAVNNYLFSGFVGRY